MHLSLGKVLILFQLHSVFGFFKSFYNFSILGNFFPIVLLNQLSSLLNTVMFDALQGKVGKILPLTSYLFESVLFPNI